VVDASVEPSTTRLAAIVGNDRLIVADQDGSHAADIVPPLAALSATQTDAFLSVAWTSPTRLLVRQTAPTGLYLIDADGGNRTSLPLVGLDPSPSADGTRLAIGEAPDGARHYSIYVTAAGLVNPRKLTTDDLTEALPAWAPDGLRLAYTVRSSTSFPPSDEIRVISANGSGPQLIEPAQPGVLYTGLRWSPDGLSVAATRYREALHTRQIVIVDANSPFLERSLGDAAGNDRVLGWSR
jgi:hypothetical protein